MLAGFALGRGRAGVVAIGGGNSGGGERFSVEVEIVVVLPGDGHGAGGEAGGLRPLLQVSLARRRAAISGCLAGEVVFLFEVGAEVVEVFAITAAEEFPVALADGGLGDPAPVEGVVRARGDFAGEVRQEVYAVEVAGLRGDLAIAQAVAATSRALTGWR